MVYTGNTPVRVSSVLVSTQHSKDVSQAEIRDYVVNVLAPRALGEWFTPDAEFIVNPSGSFALGGPSADCGVTGRKIIVDSYGGAGRHGGGAFSGKDPSKVDRSGAYYCRYVARRIVQAGLAQRAEVQVSYAIGRAKPMSVKVDTFGTGDAGQGRAVRVGQLRLPARPTSSRNWTCSSRSTRARPTTGTSARPACPGKSRSRWPSEFVDSAHGCTHTRRSFGAAGFFSACGRRALTVPARCLRPLVTETCDQSQFFRDNPSLRRYNPRVPPGTS